MLRLSKKADYALIAMKHLAIRDPAVSSAREIAEQYRIPVELMAKVLQRLARRGLLSSLQGTRGGYQLARPAIDISLADVIQAIDGPLTVTACAIHGKACQQYETCNVRNPLRRIRARILEALATCSLLEIAVEPREKAAGRAGELTADRRGEDGVDGTGADGTGEPAADSVAGSRAGVVCHERTGRVAVRS